MFIYMITRFIKRVKESVARKIFLVVFSWIYGRWPVAAKNGCGENETDDPRRNNVLSNPQIQELLRSITSSPIIKGRYTTDARRTCRARMFVRSIAIRI